MRLALASDLQQLKHFLSIIQLKYFQLNGDFYCVYSAPVMLNENENVDYMDNENQLIQKI